MHSWTVFVFGIFVATCAIALQRNVVWTDSIYSVGGTWEGDKPFHTSASQRLTGTCKTAAPISIIDATAAFLEVAVQGFPKTHSMQYVKLIVSIDAKEPLFCLSVLLIPPPAAVMPSALHRHASGRRLYLHRVTSTVIICAARGQSDLVFPL